MELNLSYEEMEALELLLNEVVHGDLGKDLDPQTMATLIDILYRIEGSSRP
jgi:hypothetical protein